MTRFHASILLLAATIALPLRGSAIVQTSDAPAASHDIDVAAMDRSIRPGDDFFGFANGAWFRRAEIPPDRSSAGIWNDLIDEASRDTRDLLDSLTRPDAAVTGDSLKVRDYYASFMDERTIEEKSLAPLAGILAGIGEISDRAALTQWVCSNLRADVDPLNATNFYTDRLFGLWFSQDLNHPGQNAPYLLQGGLGMPDRDYYVDTSAAMETIRTSYKGHIAAVLKLAHVDEADSKAQRIFGLEQRIAQTHASRTDSADVQKANNPWKREDFKQRAPGIDWPSCFDAAGLQTAPEVIVWHPTAVTGIAALVGSEPIDVWRDYLGFHVADHYASVLPKALVDERFAFYGKTLSGTPQIRQRWERAVAITNDALGDAVGRLYVEKHFPPEAKAQLQIVVKNIVAAFEKRIDALTWMNPKTKANARAKLSTLIVGVGYPDRWRDYSKLEVVRGEAFMNAWRAERFNYEYHRSKLGRPVDRSEWWMTPQTVNAVNLPLQNALNFPAAILRAPFYDRAADLAMIYGGIGSVIGHEISHSFDDQGSQFDAGGKLFNWWTPQDFTRFNEAAAKLVAQYNAYTPLPGLHVNGQLTLSENIADVAGLSAAYDAYRSARAAPRPARSNRFTQDQKFFISFGQAHRSKMREPLLRQIVITDGHAPDEFRADTVRNIDGWYEAFNVERGAKLYLAPADRVRVW
jgi:putative endopeptidase